MKKTTEELTKEFIELEKQSIKLDLENRLLKSILTMVGFDQEKLRVLLATQIENIFVASNFMRTENAQILLERYATMEDENKNDLAMLCMLAMQTKTKEIIKNLGFGGDE